MSIFLNDVLFKIVFGTQKNETALKGLLNSILGLKGQDRIVELTVLSPVLDKDFVGDKGPILDIKSKDGSGRHINLEVQVANEKHYIRRSLYYVTRLCSEQMERGSKYQDMAQCISISILDFTLYPKQTDLHSLYRLYDVAHGRELTDLLEVHYLELPKFSIDKPRLLMSPIEKWLHILRFGELYLNSDPLPEELANEEGISMAIETAKTALSDDEVKALIEAHKRARFEQASALAGAMEEGVARGEATRDLAHARKMLELGLAPDIIKEVTGIDPSQLSGS